MPEKGFRVDHSGRIAAAAEAYWPLGAVLRSEGVLAGRGVRVSAPSGDSGHDWVMRLAIAGVRPPGRTFCRPDGSVMNNVHVGVQLRSEPGNLISGDAPDANWILDIDVVRVDGIEAGSVGDVDIVDRFDFRGPAVHGQRGDRFVYLTWGNLEAGHFEMFRRAKLMLNRIDPEILQTALRSDRLAATVELTDALGGPRCARVDPPAVKWAAL